jgi:replicative DNA helicase
MTPDQKLLLAKISSNPKTWAEFFLKVPRTGEPFVSNYVQNKLFASKARKKILLIHRRGGKCEMDTNYMFLSSGERVQAKDLINKHFKLLTLHEGKQIEVDAYAEYNAYEDIYEIETETGLIFRKNAEHPLWKGTTESVHQSKPILSSKGWTKISDLKEGDLIALPKELNYIEKENDISDAELKFIAYLIGDGGVSTKTAVQFSQENNAQLKELYTVCEKLGVCIKLKKNTTMQYGLSNALSITRKFDIQGKNSFQKVVPAQIFKCSKRQVAIFLSRLYSTDGWASQTSYGGVLRGSGQIGYCSVSRELITGVQHLLKRFGIRSNVEYKPVTNSYTLSIKDFENIILF